MICDTIAEVFQTTCSEVSSMPLPAHRTGCRGKPELQSPGTCTCCTQSPAPCSSGQSNLTRTPRSRRGRPVHNHQSDPPQVQPIKTTNGGAVAGSRVRAVDKDTGTMIAVV
eukprot:2155662-Pyramimonas_sp.AAC.1